MVLLWHHLKNTHWNLCFEECMRLCSNCSFQIFLTNCPQFFLFCFFESDETVLVCSECVVNIWYSISTSVTMLVFSSAKRPSRTTEINWVAVRFASAYVHYSISPWCWTHEVHETAYASEALLYFKHSCIYIVQILSLIPNLLDFTLFTW